MIIMSGPKVGTVMKWLSTTRIPEPRPTPTRAVRIGRPMATTDPNARSMTTTAASRPIISLDPGAAETTCSTGAPPTATCRPGGRSCAGGGGDPPDGGRRQVGGRGVELDHHEADPAVARRLQAGPGGERALHALDVRQRPQGPHQPVDGRDAGGAVERDRRAQDHVGAVALLRREAGPPGGSAPAARVSWPGRSSCPGGFRPTVRARRRPPRPGPTRAAPGAGGRSTTRRGGRARWAQIGQRSGRSGPGCSPWACLLPSSALDLRVALSNRG